MSDNDTQTHSVHEAAVAGQELLNALTEIASRHQMSRPLVLSLLGMFAKHVIELEVEDGKTEPEAVQGVLGMFLNGAGIVSVFDNEIDKGTLQ